MLFNSPIGPIKADMLIELLSLSATDRVIDVGCGTGEFLIRIGERYGASGVGVDIDGNSLELARSAAAERGCGDRIQFIDTKIQGYECDEPFDCGVCMGATHAYAMDEPAYVETLNGLGQSIRVGGLLLIGESYWIREPDQEYVDFVGEPSGTYRTHRENVELAEAHGLRTLYATTSSLDEWDDFEWRHHMRIEKMASEAPDDVEVIERRDRGRAWRAAYLKWGRGTLGFGFYLFRREE
ncbi:MAG: methyltransferase domain-containing protein [Planctomycetota bacterium]